MDNHTKGTLEKAGAALVESESRSTIAFCVEGGRDTATIDANARRLVACWNICEGIDTEVIEREKYLSTAGYAMRTKAERERDCLKEINAELLSLACEMEAFSGAAMNDAIESGEKMDEEVWRIRNEHCRAVIAKSTKFLPCPSARQEGATTSSTDHQKGAQVKYTNYTVNDQGMAEIKKFLAENHRLGGDHFTDDMLRAWAAEAERCLSDGDSEAFIELSSWDSIHGRTQTFTISSAGIDKETVEEDD